MTVHQLPVDCPTAPQGNQCLLSHFLASLGAQEKTNCTSMLWSIDSCQNRISADQYHLTVPRAQVSTHRGRVFFEVIRWQITSFKWSQAQVYFFQGFISNMLCLCHYGPALLGFWFQTDLGRENSASFLKYRQGRPFLTMVTRWLCTFVGFESMIWPSDQVWYKLTELFNLKSLQMYFLTANRKKTFRRIFSYNFRCRKKLWAIFLLRGVHLWKQ